MNKRQRPSRLDRAVDIGSGFDWITPVVSLFGGRTTYKVREADFPDELRRLKREGKRPRNVNCHSGWTSYDL